MENDIFWGLKFGKGLENQAAHPHLVFFTAVRSPYPGASNFHAHCQGVFTGQFIFRTVLARILNIHRPINDTLCLLEAPLGVFGIRDICGKNYRDTGYSRKKLLGYRILRSSFRDAEYSQKIVTYQMFDEKRSWITKYMPFSVFLLMIRYK